MDPGIAVRWVVGHPIHSVIIRHKVYPQDKAGLRMDKRLPFLLGSRFHQEFWLFSFF